MQYAQQLGRYHLLDRVAFGGMAEIYRAKTADVHGRLHLVAVKRVLGHLCEDDEFIQMLIDEAKLTALLKHDNIARVYEFSRFNNEYFIAMEYVDGKDMRAMLERARQNQEWLPEDLIAYIGMQVARGLNAAFNQRDRDGNSLNIVHRDVSPSNVLLSYNGDVKLCDFGIAKASGSRSQTKTGVIKGKVKYMSPEQAMGRKLDSRSDLFSLGTLMYEMLTLQAPFTATTEIELLFAVRDARKRPIRELRPNLHAELEIVIDRAMAKSRSQRFQSGEEFAGALQAFLDAHYPQSGAHTLQRYMRAAFAKEIAQEQATLAEYVIEGKKNDPVTDLGENLLADVLGPDAEYTQFTAAFNQEGTAMPAMSALPVASQGLAVPQMRVMASVTMPGTEAAPDFEGMPTSLKERQSAEELGLSSGVPEWAPSAQTMPRAISAAGAARLTGAQPPVSSLPLLSDSYGNQVDQGMETMMLQRHTPAGGAPYPFSQPTPIEAASPSSLAFDDQIHVEQTRILGREQFELLSPPKRPPDDLLPASMPSVEIDGDFHAASTQILDMRSLPADMQQLLQNKGIKPVVASSQTGARPVIPVAPAQAPLLQMAPLDSDFHDAATAYLDWSPLEPETKHELPMDPSPHELPSSALITISRPEGRTGTGLHAPIALPRSTTGAQVPVASPQASTLAAAPLPPPPAPGPLVPTAPPHAATMAAGFGNAAGGTSSPLRPLAASPLPPPAPRTPTAALPPVARGPVGAQAAPAAARAVESPSSGFGGMGNASAKPAPAPAPTPRPAVVTQAAGNQDEWESLPHLDSTMIALGQTATPKLPPKAAPAANPVLRHPAPFRRDPGDMPTLSADQGRKAFGHSLADMEPVDHTIANMADELRYKPAQFEDLPTPVKGTQLGAKGAAQPLDDFEEDTNKGTAPHDMAHADDLVDASMELDDADLETVD